MKISFNYAPLSKVKADLLVLVLDERKLYESDSAEIRRIAEQAGKDFAEKKLKREFYLNLNSKLGARNLVVYSTSQVPAYDLNESIKIFTARALRLARDYGLKRVAIALNGEGDGLAGKAVEGALLGSYSFDRYKKEKENFYRDLDFQIVSRPERRRSDAEEVRRYTVISEAVNECRTAINEPGSVVYPEVLAETARRIARKYGLKCRVLDEKQLARHGYNGLVQVGKGSIHPPRLIVLRYTPPRPSKITLAYVGKGITFDSGGISLKPADKMYEMKGDMSGGAATIYALKAIARLKAPVNVVGIVAAAENLPDAKAQRPGDIFIAKNGKSVMVDNTDAEGRLVLTDGLYEAGREGATHIIDVATLTGAVVRALGPSVAGIFGNDERLVRAVIRAGAEHGEVYWQLPLVEEYKEMLKTPYADINNIGGNLAGAVTAALFLREFVPEKTPWAHLDIAGPFLRDKEWKYYEAGAIGFGTKTLIELALRFEQHMRG